MESPLVSDSAASRWPSRSATRIGPAGTVVPSRAARRVRAGPSAGVVSLIEMVSLVLITEISVPPI